MPDVRMPDGTIIRNVPEGTTKVQLEARYRAAKAGPDRRSDQSISSLITGQKPTSFLQGVAEGVAPAARNMDVLSDSINPVMWLAKAVGRAVGRPIPSGNDLYKARQQAFRDSRNQGSTLGQVAGTLGAAIPAMFLPGGPVVQGAAGGVLTSSATAPGGFVKDAALGGIGGKVGDKVIGGVSRVVSPRVAPAVRRLQQRGIPLTPGQILGAGGGAVGRTARTLENKLTSVPGVGDAITRSYQRGQTAVNQAAFNEALTPINRQVPDIAEAGIEQARRAVSQGYDDALGNVRVVPDGQFAADITKLGQAGKAPGNFADDFSRIMRDEVGPIATPPTGALNGKDVQDLMRIAKGYSRQYRKLATTGANGIPQPSAKPVAGAFRDLNEAVENILGRQAPDVMPAYSAANEAYRNVGVLRDAVNAAKVGGAGEFTPAQLSQAARANAKKFGGTHGTTDQPFFDLTRDAQDVLPSVIPNSGTTDRGLVGLLLGGTVGLPAVAASGLASVPYTRGGQKVAESLLTGRQGPAFKTLAQLLEELRPVGVGLGAGTFPLLLGGS